MELNEREKEIYNILCEKDRVSVNELSKIFYVSEMTIRRDLAHMSELGLLKRYRGGAVLTTINTDMPISQRFYVDASEKKTLGKRASLLVSNGMTVYIDSSSTCQYIIPHIAKLNDIHIITNSVNAMLSASRFKLPCILIGGEYYSHDMCFTGAAAEQFASQFNPDIAFFSSRALSDDGVITDVDIEQTSIRKVIMKNSKKNIFLFETSKLGQKFVYTVCRAEDVDKIIKSE